MSEQEFESKLVHRYATAKLKYRLIANLKATVGVEDAYRQMFLKLRG